MKRVFTALLVLTLCFVVLGFGQAKKWQFVKVFPDTAQSFTAGLHGIAVDPLGRVWVGPAGVSKADTLPNGKQTAAIYVFNANGTEAAISRIKIINTPGASDTLTSLCRGMRTAPDGNIAYVGIGGYVYLIDYKTGLGIRKVNPVAPAVASGIAPAFTSAGEMLTGHVAPGNPVKLWGSDFSALGTVITSSIGYSRTVEISKDGNDIYWCGYDKRHVKVYHSDLGTLGTYALVDSFGQGMQVESTGWQPGTGLLWLSSGNRDTTDYGLPPVDPPWKDMTWYGFNVTTKKQTDSLRWEFTAYPYPMDATQGTLGPRPRGIDFSKSGDTAYVITYNYSKAAMQMFRRVTVGVEQVESGIPSGYLVSQNYPNPFNPSTEIAFAIPKAGFTTIKVYDMLGKEVATLVNEELAPGSYKTRLDGTSLASGSYVYVVTSGDFRMSKKMLLLK
jgi:hypothetical protein